MKFDADGLEITQTTIDGQAVDMKFKANTSEYGLFRASDGKIIQGAKTFEGGVVRTVTQALSNPSIDDNSWVEPGLGGSMASDDGFGLTIYNKGAKCGGIYGNENYVSFGSPPVSTYDVGSFSVQNRYPEIRCFKEAGTGWMQFVDPPVPNTSSLMAWQCWCDIIPAANRLGRIGLPGYGWEKYYGYSTSIASTSDEREKHDMAPVDIEMMRKFVMALDPTWYRLNVLPNELMVGFRAQQFKDSMTAAGMPEDFAGFIGANPDHLCLDYGQIIAPLVSVAQSHQKTIDLMQYELDEQRELISCLESNQSRIDVLEADIIECQDKILEQGNIILDQEEKILDQGTIILEQCEKIINSLEARIHSLEEIVSSLR